MTEKMDELYKKYFEERLNLIFFGGNGVSFKKSFYAPYEPKEKITVEPPKGYVIDGEFHDGFARVKDTNAIFYRYNYIDKDGKLLKNKHDRWESAGNFKGGYAWVGFEAFRGFIDTNGNIVPYDHIVEAFDDCFIRRVSNFYHYYIIHF